MFPYLSSVLSGSTFGLYIYLQIIFSFANNISNYGSDTTGITYIAKNLHSLTRTNLIFSRVIVLRLIISLFMSIPLLASLLFMDVGLQLYFLLTLQLLLSQLSTKFICIAINKTSIFAIFHIYCNLSFLNR